MKRCAWIVLTLLSGHLSIAMATPAMTVSPSTTSLVVRSDSESAVLYTVTNNASVALSQLAITPAFDSTGQNLSVTNNNCASTLAANASCTFTISVPGSGQPSSFTIRPRVCASNNALCVKPLSSAAVTVTVNTISSTVRAYVNNTSTSTIEAITTTDDSVVTGNGTYQFADTPLPGVAVSADGQTIYVANSGSSTACSLAITDVSASTPASPTTVALDGTTTDCKPSGVGVSPTGDFVYVAGFASDTLYKVDLSDNSVTSIALGASASDPRGVVVSPDGSRVYVTNTNDSVSVINTATNAVVTTIENVSNFTNLILPSAVLSPDGSKLYVAVAGSSPTEPGLAIIDTTTNTVSSRITDALLNGFSGVTDLAISPDGNTLYVLEAGTSSRVASVDLTNSNTVSELTTSDLSTPKGIAITPDGTTLYVTNSGGSLVTKIVIATPSVTTISVDGGQTVFGNFVG